MSDSMQYDLVPYGANFIVVCVV